MRVALYARYSSDLQNERSAEDQLAALRIIVAARGWREAAAFVDRGISGSALANRPGVQTLMLEAAEGRFDIVLAEALDRLSRDQEGTAHLYKRLTYHGVVLETLSEGRVSELHVGLSATMNQMFLVELGKKTRRGLEARIRAGFSGGGRCYGYRIAARGELEIEADEANVVRRIFAAYDRGQSPRAIAAQLNAEGLAGPRGGAWTASSINGDRRVGNGVLHNELYVGVRVWNRQRFRKHPDTGRRHSLANPPDQWIRTPMPDLRLVDDEIWSRVQARKAGLAALPRAYARRPKRLLSGLMRCGLCEGTMTLQGARYACSNARERGTCANHRMIAADAVERRVLAGLQARLLSPAAVAEAVRAYHDQARAGQLAALRDRAPMERELADIARKLDRATQAYLAGALELADYETAAQPLKARRAALGEALAASDAPAAITLHPTAPAAYRALAENLAEALSTTTAQTQTGLGHADPEDEADVAEAREILRKLIDSVDFTPREGRGQYDLTVHGKLKALLGIPERASNAAEGAVLVVAGARSGRHLTSFAA